MATTTPNYGWTVPTSTDLVKDGATAIETLGDAIDASMNTALGTKKAGMVLLNTTSFSGVSSQAVNPFSATYDAYKIVFTLTAASGDPTMTFRIRDGVTDLSGADYYYGGIENKVDSATVGTNRGNAATSFGLSNLSSAQAARYFVLLDVINPFATTATKISYQGFVGSASGFYTFVSTGIVANSTSYNGYNIIASTGTITGKVVTYGYNL